jgi:hypothetical protein
MKMTKPYSPQGRRFSLQRNFARIERKRTG